MDTQRTLMVLLLLTVGIVPAGAQTYRDDSLAVREILDANGFDTIPVENVTSNSGSRIYGLYLDRLGLRVLPECLGDIDSLGNIQIQANQLTSLPHSIGNLKYLRYLSAYENNLHELPDEIAGCTDLVLLYLIRNHFTQWPDVLAGLTKLETIDLGGNHLTEIPDAIAAYPQNAMIYLNDNYLADLPESITRLNAGKVRVAGNKLCSLSPVLETWLNSGDTTWGKYQSCNSYSADSIVVQELLDNNGWGAVSFTEVTESNEHGITRIDVSSANGNARHGIPKRKAAPATLLLPKDMYRLRYLQSFIISGKGLDALPDDLHQLCQIPELDISNNNLTSIPECMAAFTKLQTLNVSGNNLSNVSPAVELWLTTYDPDWRQTQQTTQVRSIQPAIAPATPVLTSARIHNRTTALTILFPQTAEGSLRLYSLTGKVLGSAGKRQYGTGLQTIHLETGAVGPGSYIAVLTAGAISTPIRFTVNQ